MVQTLVKGEHKTTLKISGNVLYVIRGEVDPSTLKPISLDDFRFALGSASPKNPQILGEAIVIERRPYLSYVENGKLATKEEPLFESPFLMGIDDKQILGALIHTQPDPPSPLESLYAELSARYPIGFAILGRALFAQAETTYLKKAPIHGENINEHKKQYWAPVQKLSDANLCLFGVVLPEAAQMKFPPQIIERGFYQNPNDKNKAPFQSHTHAALLTSGPEKWPHNMNEFFKSLRDLPVEGVRHLLTQSLLQEATFAIFPLGDIILL
jgi:hypothetical protein